MHPVAARIQDHVQYLFSLQSERQENNDAILFLLFAFACRIIERNAGRWSRKPSPRGAPCPFTGGPSTSNSNLSRDWSRKLTIFVNKLNFGKRRAQSLLQVHFGTRYVLSLMDGKPWSQNYQNLPMEIRTLLTSPGPLLVVFVKILGMFRVRPTYLVTDKMFWTS